MVQGRSFCLQQGPSRLIALLVAMWFVGHCRCPRQNAQIRMLRTSHCRRCQSVMILVFGLAPLPSRHRCAAQTQRPRSLLPAQPPPSPLLPPSRRSCRQRWNPPGRGSTASSRPLPQAQVLQPIALPPRLACQRRHRLWMNNPHPQTLSQQAGAMAVAWNQWCRRHRRQNPQRSEGKLLTLHHSPHPTRLSSSPLHLRQRMLPC